MVNMRESATVDRKMENVLRENELETKLPSLASQRLPWSFILSFPLYRSPTITVVLCENLIGGS